MAKVKNVSGDAWVDVETNTRVAKGAPLEIPDDRAWGYCQMEGIWKAADKATEALAESQRPKEAAEEISTGVEPVEPSAVTEKED